MIVIGKINPLRQLFLLFLLWSVMTGCTAPGRPPVTALPVEAVPSDTEQLSAGPGDPREQASIQLTEQGRMLLETGRVDDAISLFERALNISPANGYNYFYLSEACILKKDFYQAREWNEMAAIHLRESRIWMEKILDQKKRIGKWVK